MGIPKRKAMRANIVSWGGDRFGNDIDVIADALEHAGYQVRFIGRRRKKPPNRFHKPLLTTLSAIAKQWAVLKKRHIYDVNFFIDSVVPEHISAARINCLYVSPERLSAENLNYLQMLNYILCRTSKSVDALRDQPVTCRYLGFTNIDKRRHGNKRSNAIRCLHLADKSVFQGTEELIEVWSHHSEWPELTVVHRSPGNGSNTESPTRLLPNVNYLTDSIPEEKLRQLQNDCDVHVCLSQAEGYRHVIGEAMSCAAVVVTTDAPPMNEMITPERGILVRVAYSEEIGRTTRIVIDAADLESKLQMVFAMSPDDRDSLGLSARAWYETQDLSFQTAMRSFLSEIGRKPG